MVGRIAVVAVISMTLVLWLAPLGITPRGAAQFGTPAASDGAQTAATLAALLAGPEPAIAVTSGPAIAPPVGGETVATLVAMLSAAEVALTAQAALSSDATQTPTPAPETCDEADIQPRSESEIADFMVEAGEETASPVATPRSASIEVPVGQPADAETTAAVEETLRDEAACFNEGKALYAFAYSTNERFRREPTLVWMPYRINHVDVITVTNVSKLDDGRVGAICVFDLQPGGQTTKYCMFALHDTRWLVDETIPLGGA